jgi:hypothetical protein
MLVPPFSYSGRNLITRAEVDAERRIKRTGAKRTRSKEGVEEGGRLARDADDLVRGLPI